MKGKQTTKRGKRDNQLPMIMLILIPVILLSCTKGSENAIKELGRRDIPFNKEAFLKSAHDDDEEAIELFLAAGMDPNVTDNNGTTPLLAAVSAEYLSIAKTLIKKGADPNIQNIEGDTALLEAVRNKDNACVKLLLDGGAKANIKNEKGDSPLLISCSQGTIEIVKLLLASGADVNIRDHNGETPLWIATKNTDADLFAVLKEAGADDTVKNNKGKSLLWSVLNHINNLDFVQMLCDGGANLNVRNKDGLTPLMGTIKDYGFRSDSLWMKLLECGADTNMQDPKGMTALMYATEYQTWPKRVQMLLSAGANVNIQNTEGKTVLMMACEPSQLEIAKMLVAAGADVNIQDNRGETALMKAAWESNAGLVEILLKAGADVNAINAKGRTALMKARNVDTLKLLINAGADLYAKSKGRNKDTALKMAAGQNETMVKLLLDVGDINKMDLSSAFSRALALGNYGICDILINHGADINRVDDNGDLPLTSLVNRSPLEDHDIEKIKKFLEYDPNVNARNAQGETALGYVAFFGHTELVPLLLKHGADIHARNKRGDTPLIITVSVRNKTEIAKLFLEAGADVNASNEEGATALMIAARRGKGNIVKMLLDAGADINARDNKGKTALMHAMERGHTDIVQMLKQAGATIPVSK